MKLPLRIRLTLWYTALLAGALLLFSGSVYVVLSSSLESTLDASLRQRVNQLVPVVSDASGRLYLPQSGQDRDSPYIPAVLLTPRGGVVSGPIPRTLRPWLPVHGSTLGARFRSATVGDLRIATMPITVGRQRIGYILVWQSLRQVQGARDSLLLFVLVGGPALLLLAGVGGYLLARRALAPVARITQTAAGISATDLHRRVPVGGTRDELEQLATTFNAMIERLEAAVERERRFTADASHELRSPLAVILAEASLALEDSPAGATHHDALVTIREQATGMKEMLAALLTLARTEVLQSEPEVVSLRDIVTRAVRGCEPDARARAVATAVQVDPRLQIDGNATLLVRAVRNVLDNAVKASPPGSTVHIDAQSSGGLVVLAVQDEGPGISPVALPHIFEPFYQVEAARTPGDSHGLGLAICRRIIAVHGGEVTVSSEVGKGSCFGIVLPLADPAAERPEGLEIAYGGR